jgi:acyl dehydratase
MPMTAQHRNQATDLKMKASDFTVPIEERYFEDYLPGLILEYGTIPISEAEIIDFATRFDPQYFHTDLKAAKDGPHGGLIATGWHTAAVMMRLVVDHYLSKVASLGSPGNDDIRWTRPVRPGDSLWIRIAILEAKRSISKPDRGVVRALIAVLNQNQECVMTMTAMNIFRCRGSLDGTGIDSNEVAQNG